MLGDKRFLRTFSGGRLKKGDRLDEVRRQQAYERFRTSHENAGPSDFPVLLVDSEEPVVESNSWGHVRLRPTTGGRAPKELRTIRST
jgi:hypothetical protein